MEKETISVDEDILSSLFESLPSINRFHNPNSKIYLNLSKVARRCSLNLLSKDSLQAAKLGSIGNIKLPYFSMGTVDSTNLFGLDELILFSFYLVNQNRYKKVSDLGANIGLHSVILSKLGYEVKSYEPDPTHFKRLNQNVEINLQRNKPKLINKAISTERGELEFIRVVGNTTGSHLAGAKENPYGELDKFTVDVIPFKDICNDSDLIKIDVEGHEAKILSSTSKIDWIDTDAVVEVGTEKNSEIIFEHFKSMGINLFAQKISWGKVETIDQMPTSYKEGSLFISSKDEMLWI